MTAPDESGMNKDCTEKSTDWIATDVKRCTDEETDEHLSRLQCLTCQLLTSYVLRD